MKSAIIYEAGSSTNTLPMVKIALKVHDLSRDIFTSLIQKAYDIRSEQKNFMDL